MSSLELGHNFILCNTNQQAQQKWSQASSLKNWTDKETRETSLLELQDTNKAERLGEFLASTEQVSTEQEARKAETGRTSFPFLEVTKGRDKLDTSAPIPQTHCNHHQVHYNSHCTTPHCCTGALHGACSCSCIPFPSDTLLYIYKYSWCF